MNSARLAGLLFSIFGKRFNQSFVFLLGAHGDAQAVATQAHLGTVAHDDALAHQVVVDGLGIGDLS